VLGLNGEPEVTVVFRVDLSEFGEVIDTKEGLDRYFVDEHSWDGKTLLELLEEDEWYKEKYGAALKHIEGGKKVVMGTVATDDDHWSAFFCSNGFPESDDYVIIQQASF